MMSSTGDIHQQLIHLTAKPNITFSASSIMFHNMKHLSLIASFLDQILNSPVKKFLITQEDNTVITRSINDPEMIADTALGILHMVYQIENGNLIGKEIYKRACKEIINSAMVGIPFLAKPPEKVTFSNGCLTIQNSAKTDEIVTFITTRNTYKRQYLILVDQEVIKICHAKNITEMTAVDALGMLHLLRKSHRANKPRTPRLLSNEAYMSACVEIQNAIMPNSIRLSEAKTQTAENKESLCRPLETKTTTVSGTFIKPVDSIKLLLKEIRSPGSKHFYDQMEAKHFHTLRDRALRLSHQALGLSNQPKSHIGTDVIKHAKMLAPKVCADIPDTIDVGGYSKEAYLQPLRCAFSIETDFGVKKIKLTFQKDILTHQQYANIAKIYNRYYPGLDVKCNFSLSGLCELVFNAEIFTKRVLMGLVGIIKPELPVLLETQQQLCASARPTKR